MKVAVVGAGWAGIAAASQCLQHGFDVTVYEASHTAGGRARAVGDPTLGELDNGQHLLVGAYEKTLNIIERDLGQTHLQASFKRLPLWLQSADGKFRIKRHGNDALALWLAKGLSLKDKWQITALLRRLATMPTNEPDTDATVSQWLSQENQTANACRWLWHPLCIATLNTEPREACANLFKTVLGKTFSNNVPGATDLLIPSVSLTDLWPKVVSQRVTMRWGQTVRELNLASGDVMIDGTSFDAAILAIPPTNLARLVSPIPALKPLADTLAQFHYHSIATCYVAVDNHQSLPAPLLMFDHAKLDSANAAQWVFDRQQFMNDTIRAQLAFVISCADQFVYDDEMSLAKALISQLKRSQPSYQGNALYARCFHEKRATFVARTGLRRPDGQTPHRRLLLAGDWTDTGYPSVIEGAVISGIKAADCLASKA